MDFKDFKVYENTPLLSEMELNILAYALSGIISDFYKNPENVRKCEEWKLKRKEKEQKKHVETN